MAVVVAGLAASLAAVTASAASPDSSASVQEAPAPAESAAADTTAPIKPPGYSFPVEVAGERGRSRDAAPGVVEMSARQLQKIPGVVEQDLIRSLQLLPGVQAASDFSSGLYIRGGGPDQTLILLDQIPLYNPTHAFGFFSTFNPGAIQNVVLYKGAYLPNTEAAWARCSASPTAMGAGRRFTATAE